MLPFPEPVKPLRKLKLALARRKLSSTKIDGGVDHPLEAWIHGQVIDEFNSSTELGKKMGDRRPDDVQRSDIEQYQLFRFRRMLQYVKENSVFYRKLFEDGVSPQDIRTYEDLEKVPLTEPAELSENPYLFLCVSQREIKRPFTTSGTSGQRKRIFFTSEDLLHIIDSISAALKTVGMTDEDTLQIMFPTIASWDPGYMLKGACEVVGFSSVVQDTMDVGEQIRTMEENGTSMLIGLTSFIYRITMLARKSYDLRTLGIKKIILSAEPLSEAMRREIESAWGCKALSQYGLTEMGLANAIECDVQQGLHVNEADFLVEVIDPETGKHVEEGKEGELVFTSLTAQGTPLIRYRTYDLSRLISPPCECGFQTISKVGKINGRLDMQTKIGLGEKVYPLLFDEALLSVPGVLNYRIIIDKAGYKDRLRFRVEVMEKREGQEEELKEKLCSLEEVRSGVERDLLEPPEVEIVELGTLEYTPKSQTIVDNREIFD